jgi:hypothetical protein
MGSEPHAARGKWEVCQKVDSMRVKFTLHRRARYGVVPRPAMRHAAILIILFRTLGITPLHVVPRPAQGSRAHGLTG